MMHAANSKKVHTRARAGESMVLVIVMLMVFFILGGAVLTAASTSAGASSARTVERQSYYYARSTLDVLDEALQSGAIGRALSTAAMDKLVLSGADSVAFDNETLLSFTPAFDVEPLKGLTFVGPVTIVCDGRASAVTGVGAATTAASVKLRRVTMSFTVSYRDIATRMSIEYWCTLNVENYVSATKQGTWSNVWHIQQVG